VIQIRGHSVNSRIAIMSRDPNKAPFSKTPGSLGCFTLKMELQIAFLTTTRSATSPASGRR
jgi:hypothetical protein